MTVLFPKNLLYIIGGGIKTASSKSTTSDVFPILPERRQICDKLANLRLERAESSKEETGYRIREIEVSRK